MIVNIVVEGRSDEGAAGRLIEHAGHTVGRIIDKRGKTNLDPDIAKYNIAAHHGAWAVFRDTDSACPVELRQRLTAGIETYAPNFRLRLAHSMTEAWLLADVSSFSSFFHVSAARITRDPDDLPHAKREVLRLCANSRSREIRRSMVAEDGDTGPLYVNMINEFARSHWNIDEASQLSPSLRRALASLRTIGQALPTS
ncbi:hypothetical protein [Microbacterium sp. PM5]|uniref:hypothetical protein n=1 Tax=Microbacterium sp. PM5 TaxID=2014534 RepID=UPI000DD124D6|nr:hypothetical protein [Microbacterium sp. PM5]AXA95950.1 hypothetical protein CEP17_05735 [Microbacterium sp. PM5]